MENVMTLCTECKAKIPTMQTRLKQVNDALYRLGQYLHTSVPYMQIDNILETNGFNHPSYELIKVDGQYSRSHDMVGEDKWLSFVLYRMESGRYEVTAYVN
jgi:hypothetical protein